VKTWLQAFASEEVNLLPLRRVLPVSPQENLVIGLNLLRLLVQNRIAEFHTELELIPAAGQADPRVKHAIDLEQHLMEGSYNKILQAQGGAVQVEFIRPIACKSEKQSSLLTVS
jgi:hypothetical protein